MTSTEIRALLIDRPPTLKTATVPTPEWPIAEVTITEMTAAERSAWVGESLAARKRGQEMPTNWLARAAARAIVDDTGTRVFSQADIEVLGNHSAAVLQRIFEKWSELNQLGGTKREPTTGEAEPPATT